MRRTKKFVIVDYGVGNMRSLVRAFAYFGVDIIISEDPQVIAESDAIIMPGDGAFKSGMKGLEMRNLVEIVNNFAQSGKPILGICLGAQILMSSGYEFGESNGLNLIEGKVVKFPTLKNVKIPQIGWNGVEPGKESWKGTMLSNVRPGADVYFIHSFIMLPRKEKNALAYSVYGGYRFCSAIKSGNIYGCQFHPEKSGNIGLAIINNFIKMTNSI